MTWFEQYPKINATLEAHFPVGVSENTRHVWCEKIYCAYSTSKALETIERNDRPAAKDIESLEKIARMLLRASEEFESLGWHGCKALDESAASFEQAIRPAPWPRASTLLGSKSVFSSHLKEISMQISKGAEDTPVEAPSVNTAFGEGPEFGRRIGKPTQTTAQFTADECAKAFHALEGKRPTVSTNDGTAYGPFLDLVYDIFETLEIAASAETWARQSVRRKAWENEH